MDATKKPILIPPEFSTYAEKHGIFQIYENILKKLIINQPEDPLQAIIDWLREPENIPRIFIIGPPGAGKRSIATMVADRLGCVHITPDELKANGDEEVISEIKQRMKTEDCVQKGWILEGLPANRYQAHGLQAGGIFPEHVVLLDAEDTVLIERVMGKRVDKLTGDVYHTTFHPPTASDVAKRLEVDPLCTEKNMLKRLSEHHRNIEGVLQCYEPIFKSINADQPRDDVFSQVLAYLSTKQRNNAAPHTPRIILLGPPGSGKSVQSALLASKYQLVNVNCDEVIKQMLSNESKLGEAMKPYVDRDVRIPDELITSALVERLSHFDAVKRGWVLHGFPTTRAQVDALAKASHEPNRVIVLDVASETVVERLSLRAVDPETGERYHILYNPPQTNEIKARLKTHPDDEEAEVLRRYAVYQENKEDVLEFYSHAQHINADQDSQSVFECIETIVINPLPTKLD